MSGVQRALRVLIVDDHPLVREGIRAMLSTDPGIEVAGEADGGAEAIKITKELEPDVVLMDISMPGMNGLEVTRRIKVANPSTAVIILTMYSSEMYVVEALRAGAAGYLAKDSSPEFLCHAIRAVVSGGTMVRSDLLRYAIQGMSRMPLRPEERKGNFPMAEWLTVRELDVLRLVGHGKGNKEIAAEMHLAEVTVKKHVQSIIGKLGASDRTQAAILAVRLGLVE